MARSGALLAVCGLAAEARIVGSPEVRTVAGGGRSDALASAIEREIARGVRGLISFGVAGALVDGLQPGMLVVADSVIDGTRRHPVHAGWADAMASRLPGVRRVPLAGSDSIVGNAADKATLHAATGASLVDMESHIAARLAARHGLPFVVLRAVADPVRRSLPPAAMIAMRPGGGIALGAVLRSLARDPLQLPRLLRIGFDAQRALRSLDRAHRMLGVGLGDPDLDELPLDMVREDVLGGPLA